MRCFLARTRHLPISHADALNIPYQDTIKLTYRIFVGTNLIMGSSIMPDKGIQYPMFRHSFYATFVGTNLIMGYSVMLDNGIQCNA